MLSPLYGQLSPLRVPTKTERVISADADVVSYILAVEAADGQQLEQGVITAVESFILGCKSDGIWSAIKSSCILAGARTLSGALVPLVGTAPTNFNFVSADYNRKTGLKGNGSTKYLVSNRKNNDDPQNSQHLSFFVTELSTVTGEYISSNTGISGQTTINKSASGNFFSRSRSSTAIQVANSNATNFVGQSRQEPNQYIFRISNINTTIATTSNLPDGSNMQLWRAGLGRVENSRKSFYSIGESLDLAALDTRVSTLMTDLAAAI